MVPTVMNWSKKRVTKDIFCNFSYCLAINDENEGYKWGYFVNELNDFAKRLPENGFL